MDLTGCRESEPADAAENLIQGKYLLSEKNYAAARIKYQKFLDSYPTDKNAYYVQYQIGRTLYREKDYEKAIPEFRKVADEYPLSAKAGSAEWVIGYCLHYQKNKFNKDWYYIYKPYTEQCVNDHQNSKYQNSEDLDFPWCGGCPHSVEAHSAAVTLFDWKGYLPSVILDDDDFDLTKVKFYQGNCHGSMIHSFGHKNLWEGNSKEIHDYIVNNTDPANRIVANNQTLAQIKANVIPGDIIFFSNQPTCYIPTATSGGISHTARVITNSGSVVTIWGNNTGICVMNTFGGYDTVVLDSFLYQHTNNLSFGYIRVL